MMLSPAMVQKLINKVELLSRNSEHFSRLMNGLRNGITDQHLDGSFDAFAFAWGLLPQWAKIMLLSVAYREHKHTFTGIKPETPIEHFTEEQRVILATACEKLLAVVVTFYSDKREADDYYSGWLPARRKALYEEQQRLHAVNINTTHHTTKKHYPLQEQAA